MRDKIKELETKFLTQNVDENFLMIKSFVANTSLDDVVSYWKNDKFLFDKFRSQLVAHLRTKGLKRYIIEYLYVLTFRYTRGIARLIHPNNIKINSYDMPKAFYYQYCESLKEYEEDLRDVYDNLDRYCALYNELNDIKSKLVLNCVLMYRLTMDGNYFSKCADGRYWQYFDSDIITCNENEVFVNCGGWIGDTVQNYISLFGNLGKIYCYEPGKENLKELKFNLKDLKNIIIRPYGIGNEEVQMNYSSDEGYNGTIGEAGEELIEVKTIDRDINEKITFINMDIEGFEIPALQGAKRHIEEETPKLAICVYHLPDDIWKIGRLIKQYNNNYQLFLRHYRQGVKYETVLYAKQREI